MGLLRLWALSATAALASAAEHCERPAPALGGALLQLPRNGNQTIMSDVYALKEPTPRASTAKARLLPPWQMGVLLIVLAVSVALSNFSQAEVVSSISSWISGSVCTNLLNKEAASSFQAMCLLVIIQMFIANVVVILVRFEDVRLPCLRDFLRWLPVSFLVSGMLGTSIFALEGTTVSTVNIIRNVLPLITFVLEKIMFNSPPLVRPGHVLSMFLTLFGTTLYGMSNFSVTRYSLVMILLGCILTVADKLLQRHLLWSGSGFQQPLAVCMIMNNTFGMLPLLLVASLTGETASWPQILRSTPWSPGWVTLVGSGLSGCCLGFYGLRVSRLVSAASVLMLQNVSKVLVILLSVLLLGDDISGLSALGCALSVVGSAWYGYVCLWAREEAAKAETEKNRGQS
ncbi:unnamed protein product [Effrenium voratum]|uniref:Sugar phosphate transporter domain-containing protein n=1 Tax=Effrenium voratum TaxID=2562239 RepID=A0AA36JP08_9DINO|nr:unnamed protein product [Effrenium voratum]